MRKKIYNILKQITFLRRAKSLYQTGVKNGKFFVLQLVYHCTKLIPRDASVWLMTSTGGRTFSDNPKAIFLYLCEQNPKEIDFYFITKNRELYSELDSKFGSKAVYLYSKKGLWLILRAKVYIYTHYVSDISFSASGGAVTVNTWHGLALKKINYDNRYDRGRHPQSLKDRLKYFGKRLMIRHSNDFVCATSDFTAQEFSRAFRKSPNQMLITGYPRNDLLSPSDSTENKNNFFTKYPSEKEYKHILFYLPTHRTTAEYEREVFQEFNFKRMDKLCADMNALLLYKPHPFSKAKIDNNKFENIKLLNTDEDLYPILSFTNLLITDYSSVFFDCLLRDMPMLFFSPDLEKYIGESREIYFNYEEFVPGLIAENHEELVVGVKKILEGEDDYREKREEVRNRFFKHSDFQSSRRFVESLKHVLAIGSG